MATNIKNELQNARSALCAPCERMRVRLFGPKKQDDGSTPNNKFILHNNYRELAACSSCPLCQFLRRELLYVTKPDGRYKMPDLSSFKDKDPVTAVIQWVHMAFERGVVYPSLHIKVGGEDALVYDKPMRDIERSEILKGNEGAARPEDRFEKMKSWIRTCSKDHPQCRKATKDSGRFLPTRLLDVSAGQNEDAVRLVISKDIDRSSTKAKNWKDGYITLSYCWGTQAQNSKTTILNIEERRRNIPIETLPETIRDAITLTRKLGLRYLWVDALCIIQPTQNDIEDWSREAKMMSQIYRNSICTIAACISDNCDGGLFELREASKLKSYRCMVKEGQRGFILEPRVDHWYSDIELATLSTRGWVLQERLLTARTIFCTEEGLYWQCATTCSSEFKDNVPTDWKNGATHKESTPRLEDLVKEWRTPATEFDYSSTGPLTTKGISFLKTWISYSQQRQVEARPWHELIYDFTRRNLTQPEDRLPAVHGIGTFFAKAVGDTYIENAGMWKGDFIGGLAWYRQWDHDSIRLKSAPSWSWASVSGQIISMYKRTKHVVNFAKVNWEKTKSTTTSNYSSSISELHISGPACRIKLYRGSEGGVFGAIDAASNTNPPPPPEKKKVLFFFNSKVDKDSLSGAKSAPGVSERIGWSGGGSSVRKDHYEIIFDVATDNPPVGTEFLCMPLVSAGFSLPKAQAFPMAVVLVPVDSARKIYRRVGWCFMWADVPASQVRDIEIILV